MRLIVIVSEHYIKKFKIVAHTVVEERKISRKQAWYSSMYKSPYIA